MKNLLQIRKSILVLLLLMLVVVFDRLFLERQQKLVTLENTSERKSAINNDSRFILCERVINGKPVLQTKDFVVGRRPVYLYIRNTHLLEGGVSIRWFQGADTVSLSTCPVTKEECIVQLEPKFQKPGLWDVEMEQMGRILAIATFQLEDENP